MKYLMVGLVGMLLAYTAGLVHQTSMVASVLLMLVAGVLIGLSQWGRR